MLSIKECRKLLGECGKQLSDERIEEFRDTLYTICHNISDDYILLFDYVDLYE